jgi:integrase/recombinase XerD
VKYPDFGMNGSVMQEYRTELELANIKETTIFSKCWRVFRFFQFIGKEARGVTKKDIERYSLELKKAGLKKSTQDMYLLDLKLFYTWLVSDNDYFTRIKQYNEKETHDGKEWITKADVVSMLPYCKSQRDRALIMLMWDSAARLNELLSLNVGDVKFESRFCRVVLSGKTGTRTIPISDSVPDLQAWLGQYKGTPDMPLFPTQKGCSLSDVGAQYILKVLGEKAGIKKSVHPHSFRHGRLTELANHGAKEMKLRLFAGWSRRSNMPEVYINTSQKDMEREILQISGVKVDGEDSDLHADICNTAPVECPRCHGMNAFDATYCIRCSMILDALVASQRIDEFEVMKAELDTLRARESERTRMEAERAKINEIIATPPSTREIADLLDMLKSPGMIEKIRKELEGGD